MSHTTLGTCEAAELDEDGLPIVPPDALPAYDDDEVQHTAAYFNALQHTVTLSRRIACI